MYTLRGAADPTSDGCGSAGKLANKFGRPAWEAGLWWRWVRLGTFLGRCRGHANRWVIIVAVHFCVAFLVRCASKSLDTIVVWWRLGILLDAAGS